MDKSEIYRRLDQGLSLKNEWRRQHPCAVCSTEAPTPADRGHQSGAVRRARAEQAMTPKERVTYRRGYLAAAQAASRWRARLLRVVQSLQREEGREIL